MTSLNIHNVVSFTVLTRNHGTWNTHNLVCEDIEGRRTEVCIFTDTGKKLIRSLNGKRVRVAS